MALAEVHPVAGVKCLKFTAVVFDLIPTQTSEWQELKEAYMCDYVVPVFLQTFCHLYFLFKAYGNLCVVNFTVTEALVSYFNLPISARYFKSMSQK